MTMRTFGWRHSLRTIAAIGWADFRMKYRGSVLGVAWSLLYPMTKYVVILHVFRRIVTDIPHYPLYLFLGLLLWEHFAATSTACMTMLQEKAAIIQKVRFPRLLLVLSVGWTHLLMLCGYIAIFFAMVGIAGAQVGVGVLYLPLIMAEATLLALAAGMLLSAYSLKFRDIPYLWAVGLQVLFWLTPVLYAFRPQHPLSHDAFHLFSGSFSLSLWSLFDLFIRFQPLSILLFDARRALLTSDAGSQAGALHTIVFFLLCFLVFVCAAFVFRHRSRYFLQEY